MLWNSKLPHVVLEEAVYSAIKLKGYLPCAKVKKSFDIDETNLVPLPGICITYPSAVSGNGKVL